MILVGDLNLPKIHWPTFSSPQNSDLPFTDLCRTLSLHQLIDSPTRIKSILDVILTDSPNLIPNHKIIPGLSNSDHHGIQFDILSPNKPKPPQISFQPIHIPKLLTLLPQFTNIQLTSTFNIDSKFNFLCYSINSIISNNFPLRTIKKRAPQISHPPYLRQLIRQKNYLFKLLKRDPSQSHKYSQFQNLVRHHTKIQHNLHATSLVSQPSKLFKYVRTTCKAPLPIPSLTHNNYTSISDYSKCETFAKIFSQSFQNCPTNTPPSLGSPLPNSIEDISFNILDVAKILKKLPTRNSTSPDGISYKILKICHFPLAPLLTEIFRLSLDSGELPTLWHHSIVIPIFKKGNASDPSNYRPISLTSTICRVFERIIAFHITNFLLNNNLINVNQFGFLKGRSTTTQLISTLNHWFSSISSNLHTDCIYFDFRKAFDSVPTNFLLIKLQHIGIRGKLFNWIKSFLSNRTFSVKINNYLSNPYPTLSGVPQGSVLGPILFLIYINDLPDFIPPPVQIRLYADDVKLFHSYSNDHTPLQNAINSLQQWSSSWSLPIAPKKCFALYVNTKRTQRPTPTYFVNNCAVEVVKSIRDLGIIIDSSLSFHDHINHITKIAFFKAYQLLRVLRTSSPNIWSMAFKLYVRSSLEYASETWNPSSKTFIAKLEKIQKFFTRKALTRCRIPYSSYPKRLHLFQLNDLHTRRKITDLSTIYKICTNRTHLNPTDLFKFSKRTSRRHDFQIISPIQNRVTSRFFTIRSINLWNTLPHIIINSSSSSIFKKLLTLFLQTHIPHP
jgi:hypothetical protein